MKSRRRIIRSPRRRAGGLRSALDTDRLRGLQVDGKLEIRGLLHWQLGRLRSAQNLRDVGGGTPPQGAYVHAIRHEPARLDVDSEPEHRRQAMCDRQIGDAPALWREQGTRYDLQQLRFALHHRSKRRVEIVGWIFQLERMQRQPHRLYRTLDSTELVCRRRIQEYGDPPPLGKCFG